MGDKSDTTSSVLAQKLGSTFIDVCFSDEIECIRYLYLEYLNTFFIVFECISNTLGGKVFVLKYIAKEFEISNTFKYII